ncbi:MAG TPA: hypothetical protein VGD60_20400 [Candidatus Acidoferrales bacterium]
MVLTAVCAVLASFAFLARVFWAGVKPLPAELEIDRSQEIEDLWPLHAQHFPQLRRSLAAFERNETRPDDSAEDRKKREELRRSVLREFLTGLERDFARMGQIVRIAGEMSPSGAEPGLGGRAGIKLLQARFRFNYRLAEFLIGTGWVDPFNRLDQLTKIMARISTQVEESMLAAKLTA